MGWAQDGAAIYFATIQQLAHDQTGFDRFANTNVIGDEQAHDGKAKGHQQRHELIGARLDGDVTEGAERASAITQLQVDRITKQRGSLVTAMARGIGQWERGRLGWREFEIWQDKGDVLF